MGRPVTQARIPTLDPHEVALAFVRDCLSHCAQVAVLLEPACSVSAATDEELAATRLYRRVRRLADYAVRGTRPRGTVRDLVTPLEPLVSSPLWDRIDIDGVVGSVDPQRSQDSAIKLVLAAAFARERLDLGEPLTTTDLAILAGMTRAGVVATIKRGELAIEQEGTAGTGGAYVVAASDARAWLAARDLVGFTAPARARQPRTGREKRPV